MVNIRHKGQRGEREAYHWLNGLIVRVLSEKGITDQIEIAAAGDCIQRNQNQTAIGGNDLAYSMGLGIEIKRHEDLSGINGWWRQCLAASTKSQEHPLLLYRQNHGKWRARTYVHCQLPHKEDTIVVVGDMNVEDFEKWFKAWAWDYRENGGTFLR